MRTVLAALFVSLLAAGGREPARINGLHAHREEARVLVSFELVGAFDEPTLDAVIQFAETPAGKLWFAKQPTIQQESFEASVRWGRELTERLK